MAVNDAIYDVIDNSLISGYFNLFVTNNNTTSIRGLRL